jgi:hypothetical protein
MFVRQAYQIITLTGNWTEYLGNLARYRLSIAEDKYISTTSRTVATHWYKKAPQNQPMIGRLDNYLGSVGRRKLRQFSPDAKSLTCVREGARNRTH